MIFLPCRRATILVPSGPDHDPDRLHLHVLVCASSQTWLLVGICSIYPKFRHDSTTELAAGEHPFIVRPSYVSYRNAALAEQTKIIDAVNRGDFVAREAFAPDTFNRICSGFEFSRFCAPKIREFYRFATAPE